MLQDRYPCAFLYRGSSEKKLAALTFDDGPADFSLQIMDTLQRHGVPATFLWQGSNLAGRASVVERALSEGHLIGNHSWDHPNLGDELPEAVWDLQVEPTNEAFETKHGIVTRYYRPPFGAVTAAQVRYLADRGMITVGWSIASLDWDANSNQSQQMTIRILTELHPGAIILMHDYDAVEPRYELIETLEMIIPEAAKMGYVWVTLDELWEETQRSRGHSDIGKSAQLLPACP